MPDIACLLLEYVSDLSRDPALEVITPRSYDEQHCMTDHAIKHDEVELLDKLLRRGAKLRAPYKCDNDNFKTTILNNLLMDDLEDDERKVEVLRVLADRVRQLP
jgi:hypothetical protein